MSIEEPKELMTGEEYGEARRKLLEAGHRGDSPELKALWRRLVERDEYLWEKYAKPLIESHRGQWAAINLQGEVIFARTASEAIRAGTERFGAGNLVYGKMDEFRGHVL